MQSLRVREGTRVRIILISGVDLAGLSEVSLPHEVHRCEEVRRLPQFLEQAADSVLCVDPARLSEDDKARLMRQLRQFDTALVVAVTDSDGDALCEDLLRMGCAGLLRPKDGPGTLERALKAILAGELWFPRETVSRMLKQFLIATDPNRLTSREREILALVGADLNNQQIADKLFITRETVRWHIKALHTKLGTSNRRALRDRVQLLSRSSAAIQPQREPGDNSDLARRAS